ncbi:VOC family protein [Sandaracinobacteroides hominis]|uniref:VOC family protein n=1 Tax=Sandaracinobacteroides hominis TaxID=2780086 RepID=UPI001A9C4C33|nr:VOC family protein [Sandaracinobacteroides hominis]
MPGSIISHVSVGVRDLAVARAFYDAVMATLEYGVVMDEPGVGVAYGADFPEFWIGLPLEGTADPGNGIHISFLAPDRKAVDAFHAVALENGGRCDGPPGERPHYAPGYYASFVRDPDGNKIEAMLIG